MIRRLLSVVCVLPGVVSLAAERMSVSLTPGGVDGLYVAEGAFVRLAPGGGFTARLCRNASDGGLFTDISNSHSLTKGKKARK